MAANNYYNQSYYDHDRRDDALPPLPHQHSYSPFDDHNYPYNHQTPSQSYGGASGKISDDADPYEDNNAIPLNGRRAKHDSTTSVSPIVPIPADDDPFVRDAQRRKKRRSKDGREGWFRGKITWVCYVLSAVQLVVFIAEIVRNAVLTKTPIEIHPSFNPMIGPSPYVLINMGARYQPCMHSMAGVQDAKPPIAPISWPCPNATALTGDSMTCNLKDLCGFSGSVPNPDYTKGLHDQPAPNQWWRFIVPIFLHAGIIHISFNLLLQLTLGRDIEKLIGSIRFTIVYFAAGIFGFVLGGNYAANGIASTGCSGSLFGILAITLLDLLYTWNERRKPVVDLLWIVLDVVIAFILGLLPGLDNFSHIGGFLMGLVLGVCIIRSPTAIARRTSQDIPYSGVTDPDDRNAGLKSFVKQPLGFFQNRRGVWWAWWLVRIAALLGALIGFIFLLKNFYGAQRGCTWCKYLSCLDVTVDGTNWCDVGNLTFNTVNDTHGKRDLVRLGGHAVELLDRL